MTFYMNQTTWHPQLDIEYCSYTGLFKVFIISIEISEYGMEYIMWRWKSSKFRDISKRGQKKIWGSYYFFLLFSTCLWDNSQYWQMLGCVWLSNKCFLLFHSFNSAVFRIKLDFNIFSVYPILFNLLVREQLLTWKVLLSTS